MLSCNSDTVFTETVQMVLDRYQIFHPQSVCAKKLLITNLFWWLVGQQERHPAYKKNWTLACWW